MRVVVIFVLLVAALVVAGFCGWGLWTEGAVVKFFPGVAGGLLGAWFCFDRLRVEMAD